MTRFAEKRLRHRFPILRHQTAIGMASLIGSLGLIAAASIAFLYGLLPFYLCIVLNAFAISILREIEHDLIHNLYFRGRRGVQNALMALIWPFLGNSFNPLHRRHLHLQHHRTSGHEEDFEERIIGNGLRFGLVKLFAMLDTGTSLMMRVKELRAMPGFSFRKLIWSIFPVTPLFYGLWFAFLGIQAARLGGWLFDISVAGPAWWAPAMIALNAAIVIWVAPNLIRQACLQILSSNLHYFGDVHGVTDQAQVFSRWYFLPLQLFTFNFGSTHVIHHFVVNQPFYLRQMVAGASHRAMRANGVRFNDVDSIRRGNQYEMATSA